MAEMEKQESNASHRSNEDMRHHDVDSFSFIMVRTVLNYSEVHVGRAHIGMNFKWRNRLVDLN